MISTVIVSYNEAQNLKKCLQSISGWADEIIVVDLESTDNTKEIITQFSAKHIIHKYVPYVELVRNFAIKQCSGEWILVLDPDEQLTSSLKKYLRTYAQSNKTGVLNIPRMNIFFGKWIKYTNFWPDYQIRFFKKGTVKWQELLHSYPITTISHTKLPIDKKYAIKHITYPSFSSFINKQKRYATIRAKERFSLGEKASLSVLVYFIIREISSRYFKHKGFLDKEKGLFLLIGLVSYFCMVEWKLKKLESKLQRR